MNSLKHTNAQKREYGFTLVEVLIALFIFSLISVGATTALTSSLRGQAQMQERLGEISELETMRALIRSDMASLTLRQRREAYGNIEPYVLRADGQELLDFTRTGRSNPMSEPRGDLQRITYRFEDGNFIRRSFSQVNPAPQSGYVDRILLSELTRVDLDFEYFDSKLNLDITLRDVRLEPGRPAPNLKVLKVDIEFQQGETLTQYFELSL